MDKTSLEKKSLNDLRYIAKMMNIKSPTKYKKPELIDIIISSEMTDSKESEPVTNDSVSENITKDDVSSLKPKNSSREKNKKENKVGLQKESKKNSKNDIVKNKYSGRKPYNKNVSKNNKNVNEVSDSGDTVVSDVLEPVEEKKSDEVKTVIEEGVDSSKRKGRSPKKSIGKKAVSVVDVDVNIHADSIKVDINADVDLEKVNPSDTLPNNTNVDIENFEVVEADLSETEVVNISSEPDDNVEVQSKSGYEINGKDTEGILDVLQEGYGFLRSENYVAGNKDTYVSPQLIRKYGLKTGDYIVGKTRAQRDNETKNQALTWITTINGYLVSEHPRRRPFETLTPIYPDEKLVLEVEQNEFSTRLIDLVAPIGKGQRGMVVSPPKAGKTVLLKKIANSITANYPDVELIVLLIDERPEEVTDMRESVNGTVVSSTFDELPERHIKVSELVLERAQRLVEYGKDVVILMDSITRLARAYNLTIPPTGRSLSGGLDPGALHKPKKFFGAARNIRGGGSLTIVATALVDTGSKLDDVIFEEFKGTGNMELHLDRKLSEKRIFPAIDINKSGTRKEELLLTEKELNVIFNIRRAMSNLGTADVTEMMVNQLTKSKTNEEFISSVKFTEKFM